MQDFLLSIYNYILDIREWVGGWLGPALPWLQALAVFVSAFFLYGIIYSIIKSSYLHTRTEDWMNYLGVGDVSKRRSLRRWKRINKMMQSDNPQQWKVAILEADGIMDEILKLSGYTGRTIDDRFAQITSEKVPNGEEIIVAHRVRNQAAREPDFQITKDEALETLRMYKRAFQALGLLN